jgi:radical SAM superfamily enzyme YgiQ (UPF0313 family)
MNSFESELPQPCYGLKTILINPTHAEWARTLPLGIAYIASVLEKSGLPIDIIDMNTQRMDLTGVKDELIKRDANIVGITSTTPQIRVSWEIAKLAKQINPNCKVVLGGVHPTALPEESLSTPYVDFVVRGEGEVTFLDLIRALGGNVNLKNVKGLSFKTGGEIIHNPSRPFIGNLDSIPFPARHLFPFPEAYKSPMLKKKLFADIITSRGCPGTCIFCNKSIFGHTFRARSPENVADEIEFLVGKYGVGEIHIADDTFSFDIERAMRICDLIIERNLDIAWSCSNGIRVDCVNRELLRKMKKAGCYRVSFGVESGSNEILKRIGKGITLQEARSACEIANDVGLTTIAFYMLGNYGESRETMEKTIAFAKSLNTDYAQFTIATPFPGTALYKLIEKHGKILTKDWERYGIYEEPLFETKDLTRELVAEMYRKAYREFYFRSTYILRRVRNIKSLRDLKAAINGFLEVFKRLIIKS